MTEPSDLDRDQRALFDVWRSLGLSEESAMNALREDGQLEVSGFDKLTHLFRSLGLSESAAQTAAVGREHGSVSEARRYWDSGVSALGHRGDRGGVRDPGLRLALEALDSMTDQECDQMWLEEQARKRRTTPAKTPAKKTAAPVKQPASRRSTTIAETTFSRGRR